MAIVGDGIVNVEGIMCGSSWNGWRGARLEMLQSIGDADCSRKKLWCCCHSYISTEQRVSREQAWKAWRLSPVFARATVASEIDFMLREHPARSSRRRRKSPTWRYITSTACTSFGFSPPPGAQRYTSNFAKPAAKLVCTVGCHKSTTKLILEL
ncbi:uncharacterized protein K441DRAFT_257054 [Cenococcum geophilum 1.58]|uniref:uncharacterized protein n=1 Tax=Cenococcum geophilum 1.58 TaxID=794803 RepID=UPI00358E06D9|nr:hypothetical protein K441DRAFT_257054 [Cenococcum geophilum 1.58]